MSLRADATGDASLDLLSVLGPLPTLPYKKGELISQPSSPQDKCYIIQSGLVKVYTITNTGETEIQIIYGPGEFFPLYWLIGRPSPNSYFEAANDCTIATIDQSTLMSRIHSDLTTSNAILHKVAQQFAVYTLRIINLSYKYGRERLAFRLLTLAERFGETSHDSTDIRLPHLSQQDLASTINMSRESVNRELNRFERLEILRVERGRIVLLQPELLRKEIHGDITPPPTHNMPQR